MIRHRWERCERSFSGLSLPNRPGRPVETPARHYACYCAHYGDRCQSRCWRPRLIPKTHWPARTRRALALDMSSRLPAPAWPTRSAGLIRSLADSRRASSQSCRAVTAPRPVPFLSAPSSKRPLCLCAGQVDVVIGVDTHRDTNTAAVVHAATGEVLGELQCTTDALGYKRVLAFAEKYPGRRVWAIEGTGSFGAGLTTFLLERGQWVVEIDPPARSARRNGAKSDELDAVRAARQALSRQHLAAPRARGDREAMRVLLAARAGAVVARTKAIGQIKALIVNAPEALRDQLRRGTTDQQLDRCSRLRTLPTHSIEHRATVRAIRSVARRALFLEAEAAEHESALEDLVATACPELLDLPGVGVITAAQFLVSWSRSGRIRNEAAFAALAGVAPTPASSGHTTRYRLNYFGDRQLNHALHTVALSRLQHHQNTKAYAARRIGEGKSPREIKRCLKRAIARKIYRVLETHARAARSIPEAA
jgi:transposase